MIGFTEMFIRNEYELQNNGQNEQKNIIYFVFVAILTIRMENDTIEVGQYPNMVIWICKTDFAETEKEET